MVGNRVCFSGVTEKETLPDDADTRARSAPAIAEVLSFVVCGCPVEPARLGEMLPVRSGNPGPFCIFGRGERQPGDPHPRVQLVRDRPGAAAATPPLGLEKISRVQLLIRANGTDALEVRNVGQCPLLRDGTRVNETRARPGDMLQLGKHLLLLCVRRPIWLPGDRAPFESAAFGQADPLGMVGESSAAWQLRQALTFVASERGHVLVSGATGTGKELAARAIHALSPRRGGPFVARSAATLPEGLIDAELFGNAKNYPHPSMPERRGLIGEAAGGTLFLDEFAELSPSLQAHLLRVLDGGEYHRLGDGTARVSDFRLIAATNRQDVALKHDLLARLTFRISVPELNERREDVPLILRHLLRAFAVGSPAVAKRFFTGGTAEGEPRLSFDLLRYLVQRNYVSHVRELEQLLWRSIERSPDDVLTVDGTEDALAALPPTDSPPDAVSDGLSAERIQAALDEHNGAFGPTFRALGLKNRHALARLIAKHGIEVRRRTGQHNDR